MYNYAEYRKKFLPKSSESASKPDESTEDPYHVGERFASESLQQFSAMLARG